MYYSVWLDIVAWLTFSAAWSPSMISKQDSDWSVLRRILVSLCFIAKYFQAVRFVRVPKCLWLYITILPDPYSWHPGNHFETTTVSFVSLVVICDYIGIIHYYSQCYCLIVWFGCIAFLNRCVHHGFYVFLIPCIVQTILRHRHKTTTKQSGRSPEVVALFSATNFSSYIIESLQLQDAIQIQWSYAWIHYNIAKRNHLMI